MNRSLGEDRCLARTELIEDETSSVFHQDARGQRAVHDKVELGRTRVSVWRVHATRPQESHRHRHAVPNNGWEVGRRRSDSVTRETVRFARGLVDEVEDKLRVSRSTSHFRGIV